MTTLQRKITPVLKKSGVKRAALFGSAARGQLRKTSDIDIVIEPSATMTLLDMVGLKQSLENKTRRSVDVVTYKSLHPLLKKRILKEQVMLYEER